MKVYPYEESSPPEKRLSKVRQRLNSQLVVKQLFRKEEAVDEETERELQSRFVRRLNTENDFEEYAIGCPLESLQTVGDGVYFYFFFLRFWGITIACLLSLYLPAIVITLLGNGLNRLSSINVLLGCSLANIPLSAETTGTNFASDNLKLSFKTIFFIIMGFEMAFSFVVFVAHIVFRVVVKKEIHACKLRSASVNKYSLMVNVKRVSEVDEEKVAAFFGQFGEVVSVYLARQYNGTMNLLMELGDKVYKYDKTLTKTPVNPQKAERLREDILELIGTIKTKLKLKTLDLSVLNQFRPIYAFVTFNYQKDCIEAHKILKNAYQRGIRSIICCEPQKIPEAFMYNGKKMKTCLPDHPDNIYHENLERSQWSRFWRSAVVVLAVVIILAASFLLNVFISALGTSSVMTMTCSRSNYTISDIDSAASNQTLQAQVANCYCSQFALPSLLTDTSLSGLCREFYLFTLGNIGITIGSSVSVAIINGVCFFLISVLVKWVGQNSRAELVERKIHFSFILQYMNTAFVSFLIYGVFEGFSLIDALNMILQRTVIKLPDRYSDFDRNWYTLVGIKIVLPVIIGIMIPTISNLFLNAAGFLVKKLKASRNATAAKYLKARNPPRFPIEANYTKVLVMMFTVLTFCSALPILLVFLLACLLIAYWADKINLLRFSRKPPLYKEDLIYATSKYIPYALIIHMVFGIVFLSNSMIFPDQFTFTYGLETFKRRVGTGFVGLSLTRAYKVLPYSIQTLMFFLVFVTESTLLPIVEGVFLKKETTELEGDDMSFRDNFERIKYASLPNYNIKFNPRYERFLKLSASNFDEAKYRKQRRTLDMTIYDQDLGPIVAQSAPQMNSENQQEGGDSRNFADSEGGQDATSQYSEKDVENEKEPSKEESINWVSEDQGVDDSRLSKENSKLN